MKLKIIPAIDLKNGKCVRLVQGDFNKETIYSNNPVEIAKFFEINGAERIHIVDLDGAFFGKLNNFNIIKKIRKSVNIELDLGGGIRNQYISEKILGEGINKIILGTIAVIDKKLTNKIIDKFCEKVSISLDIKNKKIAIKGWVKSENIFVKDIIEFYSKLGINEFIYTDISKDGMLKGFNTEELKEISNITKSNIILSGGISGLEDIKLACNLKLKNLFGIIIGKAIYSKKIDLSKVIKFINK